MIENSDQIYQHLKESLPQCHVVLVEGTQIANMSIHDQVGCLHFRAHPCWRRASSRTLWAVPGHVL